MDGREDSLGQWKTFRGEYVKQRDANHGDENEESTLPILRHVVRIIQDN